MQANDLNRPLRHPGRRTRRPVGGAIVPVILTLAGLVAAIALVWVAVVDEPEGGRFRIAVPITEAEPPTTAALGQPRRATHRPEPPAADAGRLAVAFAGSPSPGLVRAGSQPLDRLIEESRFGPLPQIAEDGLRPIDAYSRPAAAVQGPRIAIVLGGLGISQTGTQDAIQRLPEDVTLAFAPYGSSLGRWVTRAREAGHEVALQVPLEPVGYPDTDPGEHTLLTGADIESNMRDLHWVMSRITSYTAVMNYMGARFTSDEMAMRSLLGEVAGRGLAYVDDGSSPHSLARDLGEEIDAPVVVADRIVDADRSPAAIARQLLDLERLARQRGLAVGIASAFPASIAGLAEWIPQAEARGITFVPISAALAQSE
ncbi:divergent polysaccharide deacetylase family protein [Faunimonas sp. B44]|uniref:divergent polysaccharide deacetylase family protein n=1 Tax=Faunimonas sp. B44 TaxID=3461493 RepID=UPI0040450598